MEIIQGTVQNVRFSTEITGANQSIRTRQITILEVQGVSVELKLSDAIIICDGDFVVMTGKMQSGMFKAAAYANKTNGVSGGQDAALSYMFGTLCILIGLVSAGTVSGLVIAAIGLSLMYQGSRHKKAITLVEQMAFV